ncbi:MAG: iron complex transport system substrate-binding protein [Halieaceae bacterium]|jgi:iron complex transport system substrate-binding protein
MTKCLRRIVRCACLPLMLCASSAQTADILVEDALGRAVSLREPASRVVALAPHIVENLYSIGAGELLVGAVAYSDYPAQAAELPRVGGVGSFSLERILALSPDLVIAWDSGTSAKLKAALQRLGLTLYVDEVHSLSALAQSLENLGALTGHRDSGWEAAQRLRTRSSPAHSTGDPTHRVPLLLQVWDRPLQSIGGNHLLTEVINSCGGRSISENISGLAPVISIESVLAADPQLIIVESEDQGAHWSAYPGLRAVANGNIFVMDPDTLYRPTLRLIQGMQTLCGRLDAIRNPQPRR